MSVHANAEITVLSTFFADFNAPPEGAGDDRGLGMIGSVERSTACAGWDSSCLAACGTT
ncbi:MAG TPA: hypothetical protein VMS04_08780 [Vicinamibacterales bacterium]|nr:hypothetical protein [Vicinamibacterales bacterium]